MIEYERVGRVTLGGYEGYLVGVRHDTQHTGGYYVFLLDDAVAPTDGGDFWMTTPAEVAALLDDWRVEWLDPETAWPFTVERQR